MSAQPLICKIGPWETYLEILAAEFTVAITRDKLEMAFKRFFQDQGCWVWPDLGCYNVTSTFLSFVTMNAPISTKAQTPR